MTGLCHLALWLYFPMPVPPTADLDGNVLDYEYHRRRSFHFDLRIVGMKVTEVLCREGMRDR